MIRWSRLLMILTPLALIWAGTHFFLDRGIKAAIEKAGTAANGARVDLRDVDTSFWRLSVTLKGLEVTDKDAPMTNALEVDALRFQMEMKPLFWKKFIVKRAEIKGIQTGTPRRRSGALPKEAAEKTGDQPSAIAEKAQELAGAGWGNLKEAYDPKNLVSPESLASYQKALQERERVTALGDEWKNRVQALQLDDLSKRSKAFVDKIKNEKFSGVEGVAKAATLLQEGQALQKDLAKAQKTFKEIKGPLTEEVTRAKTTLKDIERLRREDIQNAVAKVKAGFSAEGLTRGLLGQELFGKIQTALGWIEKTRAALPDVKKKEPPPPPPPSRLGRTIPFPFHHRWPAFHLKTAALSGRINRDNPLTYEGHLKNVSSDPALVGAPITLDIAGSAGERALHLNAAVALAQEPKQTVDFTYRGLPLSGMKLGKLKGPVSLQAGRGAVQGKLEARGSGLSGEIKVKGESLKIAHEAGAEKLDRVSAALDGILTRIQEGDATVMVSGTLRRPVFEFTTSLDDQFRNALKGAFDQELARLKDDVEKQVAGLVDKETQKLSELLNQKAGDALAKLDIKGKDLGGLESEVQKVLDDLAKKGTKSIKLPDLKNIFKKN